MNHKTVQFTLALCGGAILTLATIGVGLAHDKKAETKSFVGHVVGLACYFGHNSIGESHRDCATTCAKSGIPLAILDQKTKTLYLPLSKNHHAPANADLMPFIEKDVKVSGPVTEKDGMKAIVLESISAAK